VKNVTVTLEERVARWARMRAAELNTSVSRYLSALLEDAMRGERGYDAARRGYLAAGATPLSQPGGRYPSRQELHDRPGLR